MTNTSNKKIVYYVRESLAVEPKVGARAFLIPINHPDTVNVSNGEYATTSLIQEVYHNGIFETLNTIYRPFGNTTNPAE